MGLQLADPKFNKLSQVVLMLVVDVFVQVMQHGQQNGPPGVTAAFETSLGWVLAGSSSPQVVINHTVAHTSVLSSNDLLQQFWEIEERIANQ